MRQHHLLLAGAALVLGLGVYLFHEVRLSPAQASAPIAAEPKADKVETVDKADKPEPPQVKDAAAAEPTARPPRKHDPTVKPEPEVPPPSDPADKANPKLDALMAEANKAYDHGEFDEAKQIALSVLATVPGNVRMLRVMVSAWCQDSDTAEAQKYYAQLPVQDRAQMKIRCERNGVTFADVPPPAK